MGMGMEMGVMAVEKSTCKDTKKKMQMVWESQKKKEIRNSK